MKLILKIIESITTHSQEDCNGVVHFEDITYILEGGLHFSCSKCYNDYVDWNEKDQSYFIGEGIPDGEMFQSQHEYFQFDTVCEMKTINGNYASVFRTDDKKLFTCYHIDGKKIIKNDAIWALSNLILVH